MNPIHQLSSDFYSFVTHAWQCNIQKYLISERWTTEKLAKPISGQMRAKVIHPCVIWAVPLHPLARRRGGWCPRPMRQSTRNQILTVPPDQQTLARAKKESQITRERCTPAHWLPYLPRDIGDARAHLFRTFSPDLSFQQRIVSRRPHWYILEINKTL